MDARGRGPSGDGDVKDFEEAAKGRRTGLVGELWSFMKHNKKWWLGPIIVMLLLVAALVFLSGTAAAPFIYTLF
jgi:hypothetical protein